MAGQLETPLTNPYITALEEGKTDRGKLLGALFRRVVQQRRILSLNHRKLITEKRPIGSRATQPVRSTSSFPVQSCHHILETSMSSEASEHLEDPLVPAGQAEVEAKRPSDGLYKQIPRTESISKCDIAINSTFDADIPYLVPVQPPQSRRSYNSRRHLSQCKAIQLTLEVTERRQTHGTIPWSRARGHSRTRFLDSAKEPSTQKSLSMQISPQLRRKQAADRLQHTQAAARVLRLYSKMETWRLSSPARPLPPSVFAPNTHWPAKSSALRVFR